ncbi:MAG: hypothetical protein ACJ8KA_01700 [Sulfurifustis sp.]
MPYKGFAEIRPKQRVKMPAQSAPTLGGRFFSMNVRNEHSGGTDLVRWGEAAYDQSGTSFG